MSFISSWRHTDSKIMLAGNPPTETLGSSLLTGTASLGLSTHNISVTLTRSCLLGVREPKFHDKKNSLETFLYLSVTQSPSVLCEETGPAHSALSSRGELIIRPSEHGWCCNGKQSKATIGFRPVFRCLSGLLSDRPWILPPPLLCGMTKVGMECLVLITSSIFPGLSNQSTTGM